ncbi:MAG: leucyl/phenylalanyl-tRNA--protein transferase [Lautropia sp.]|nr:leucyl/phenylalanyl-tRNA--protein transferase [Lautropia sp.]
MNDHWVEPDMPLPRPERDVPGYPGLIALGRDLGPARLLEAYRQGIFPWYSDGQPVLWWSTDPRMVVFVDEFQPSRSLRRLLKQLADRQHWQLSLNTAFTEVMRACAAPRDEQGGTWITEDIIRAYTALHRRGLAHSVEVRENGELIGGLYGVSIGRMFFGESMFTRRSNASKCAFAALMALLREHGFEMVDCQQSTRHLGSLGGRELPRAQFLARIARLVNLPAPDWQAMQPVWPTQWPACAAAPTAANTPDGMPAAAPHPGSAANE